MSQNESWNELSSIAKAVMPRTAISDNIFSLTIEYFGGAIEKVSFQLPPESITESKGSNFASDSVLGRFEPIRMYTNSEATKINFSVNYYWLEDSFLNSIGSWPGIKDQINKLRAIMYPYDSGRSSIVAGAGPITSPGNVGAQAATDTAAQEEEFNNFWNLNAFNQFVGKSSPPPIVRLWYGDLYRGTPCILTNISIEYKGPWNDASFASFARRMAASTTARYSNGLAQTVKNLDQIISPITNIVNYIPPDFTTKSNLVNNLIGALRSDKLFPFCTTVNVTLESNYPFGTQMTYGDVRSFGAWAKSGLSKIIENVPIVGKMLG
jgi:hypothetical protein